MEKVQRDPLECKICWDLPEGPIFQCKNGHTICERCCANLAHCPQCRVPYERNKIRNRALEELIGTMQIFCQNKEYGCEERIARNEMQAHLQICKFRPMDICEYLGYSNCSFVSSKPHDLFSHLATHHQLSLLNTKAFRGTLAYDLRNMRSEKDADFIGSFLVQFESFQFLTTFEINKERGEYSFNCFHFCETDEQCPYKLTVSFVAPQKDIRWSWGVKPVWYKNVEDAVQHPAIKIPIAHFLEGMDERESMAEYEFSPN